MRRLAAAAVALLAVASVMLVAALPAGAGVTAGDVEEARERLREVSRRLNAQVVDYESSVVREVELRERLDGILVDLAARERELAFARRQARSRVADIYMNAGTHEGAAFLAVSRFSQVPARKAYLDSIAETDRAVIVQLDAARIEFERHQALLEETLGEQGAIRSHMEGLLSGIYTELEAANAEYQVVKAAWDRQEEERRYREWLATSTTTTIPTTTTTRPVTTTTADAGTTTTADGVTTTTGDGATTTTDGATTTTAGETTTTTTLPPPPPQPGRRVCPVDGATTFTDTWLEPRPGGRQHLGVDMLAATGTPLVAIEDGYIWYMSWHYAGGNGLYIQGDSGDRWYYAHLHGYAPGIRTGVRVAVGQLVGYVGSTGNATTPHLHLGYLPGAAYWANPYPVVLVLC